LILVVGTVGVHLFFLWSIREQTGQGAPDFTSYFTAGVIVRTGEGAHLYDFRTQEKVQAQFAAKTKLRRGPLAYIHPPFEALLFVPLSLLPYRQAFLVWSLVNLGLLLLVAYWLRESVAGCRGVNTWLLAFAFCAFFPVLANFHQGQDAILLLVVVCLAFRALKRESLFAAGCLLGLGMFKFHIILPLALVLGAWHGLRFVAGFLASSSGAGLVSLLLVGWRGALEYPSFAWQVVSAPALGGVPFHRLPNLLGLVGGWSTHEVGWEVKAVVLVGSMGLLIAAVWLRPLARNQSAYNLGFGGAVIVAALVGYSSNTYDLCLLILPLAIVADHLFSRTGEGLRAKVGLYVPALLLSISPLWFFLWMKWEHLNVVGALLLWWFVAIRREVGVLGANRNDVVPSSVG
jgi:hypothetical protein